MNSAYFGLFCLPFSSLLATHSRFFHLVFAAVILLVGHIKLLSIRIAFERQLVIVGKVSESDKSDCAFSIELHKMIINKIL